MTNAPPILTIGVPASVPANAGPVAVDKALRKLASPSLRYYATDGRNYYLFSSDGLVVPLSLARYFATENVTAIYGVQHGYASVLIEQGKVTSFAVFKEGSLGDLAYLPEGSAVHVFGEIGDRIKALGDEFCGFSFHPELPDFGAAAVYPSSINVEKGASGRGIVLIAGLIGAATFMYFMVFDEEASQAPADVIEAQRNAHFQQFYDLDAAPSMHLQLQAAYSAVQKFTHIDGWLLSRCTSDGYHVSCSLSSTRNGKLAELRQIPNVSLALAGETIEVTTPLEFPDSASSPSGVATPLMPVMELFHDRMVVGDPSVAVRFEGYQKVDGLERQEFRLVKESSPLGFLEFASESAKGLPIKLQSFELRKAGNVYAIDIVGYTYTTYPFIPLTQG